MRSSWRRALGMGIVAACMALPSLAWAADPKGPDTLVLQDGTTVTGVFTEFVPNNRVTVLVNGESKTFQWSLVRKASHDGKTVAENQPAALPPPVVVVQPQPQQQVIVVQGQPAPRAALEESVLVHLEGDDDAVLEMQERNGDKDAFTPACQAPCNKMLPLDRMYRITGDGIRGSKSFKLAGAAGNAVTVDVNAGHKGAFVGGIVMTVIGPLTLVVGSLVYLAGSVNFSYSSSTGSFSSDKSGLKVTGGVLMLGGAALTAVGIPLLVSNARTKVTQEVGTPVPRRDAMLRTATFRDSAHELQMPAFNAVPVLTHAF